MKKPSISMIIAKEKSYALDLWRGGMKVGIGLAFEEFVIMPDEIKI